MSPLDVVKEELSTVAGFHTREQWAQRILDALDRGGYVVVELPNPNVIASPYETTTQYWPVLVAGERESVYMKRSGEVVLSGICHFDKADVRNVAAALLAAADAAEAQS